MQERLQNEDGCDLVDDQLAVMTAGGVASGIENFVGCVGGETLIPKIDGDAQDRGELVRKGLGFFGLRAEISGHVHRVTHYDVGAVVAAEQAAEGLDIGPAIVGAVQSEERLGGIAEFVGDSHADAPVANVEGGDAGFCWIR